jgi:hypothetical protein
MQQRAIISSQPVEQAEDTTTATGWPERRLGDDHLHRRPERRLVVTRASRGQLVPV